MSDKSTKTVMKTFFAWNDGREEAWLRAQALRGWHLVSVAPFLYRFRRGVPADVTYRLDFRVLGKIDKSEYLGLFRDAGWENVCRQGSWYYFRTPTGTGMPPDIHTDNASRAAMYRRLLLFLFFMSIVLLNGVLNPVYRRYRGWTWDAIWIFQTVLLALLVYGVVRLALLVRRLGKTGQKS
jgi:hypothetical protein